MLAHGPLSIGDLTAHPFLLREKGSAARAAFDALMGRHGLEVTPAWESTSTQALIGAAAAGLGLALLPEPLARAALERGDVVRVEVEDAPPAREFFAVFHKNKYLPRAAQDLIALCRKGEEKADK